MKIDRDHVIIWIIGIIFIGYLYSIFLKSVMLAYIITFTLSILILEITFNLFKIGSKIVEFLTKFSLEVKAFLLVPILYSELFSLSLLLYKGNDLKPMVLGIYTIYITISTILLSIAFVAISILPGLAYRKNQSRRRKIHKTTEGLKGIPGLGTNLMKNSIFLAIISISSVSIIMYSFISTSFENNLTKLNLLPGFFISSFLLVVSILGIMYLGVIFGQELGFLSEIKN